MLNKIFAKVTPLKFITNLVKANTGYSSKSFLLVAVTFIGVLLLLMPVFILTIEAWFNHTIQTNLSDMAAYIASVAALFGTAGITKAWSERNERRLPGKDGIYGTDDDVFVNMNDDEFNDYQNKLNKKYEKLDTEDTGNEHQISDNTYI